MHVHAVSKPVTISCQPRVQQLQVVQAPSKAAHKKRRCVVREYTDPIPYSKAWQWQKELVAASCSSNAPDHDTVLLLQHLPVYTLGAGSTTDHLKFDPDLPPHPLYRTERGGEVTYHGPGQLVLYPILNLKMHSPDMHWYLRCLEEVVIRTLESVSGLQGERIAGCTGVWVNNQKVAAVGVRAQRWVTYHGVALNVTTDLQPFQHIVPCGIAARGVTSVQQLTASAALPDSELLREYQYGLLDAFAEVFDVDLESLLSA